MKSFKQHILEKLKVSVRNTTKHTLFPKTKNELKHMIEDEISKHGNECSLNHIDVSEITDMSSLFYYSKFNGNISEWNVSNVKVTMEMFTGCTNFNCNLSKWNVKKVVNMYYMFDDSGMKELPSWYKEPDFYNFNS